MGQNSAETCFKCDLSRTCEGKKILEPSNLLAVSDIYQNVSRNCERGHLGSGWAAAMGLLWESECQDQMIEIAGGPSWTRRYFQAHQDPSITC